MQNAAARGSSSSPAGGVTPSKPWNGINGKTIANFNWNTVPFLFLFYVISLLLSYREKTRYIGYVFLIIVYAFTWVRLFFHLSQFSRKVSGLFVFRRFLEPYISSTGTSMVAALLVFLVFLINIFSLGQMLETYTKVGADQGTYVLQLSDTMKDHVHLFNNTFVASNLLFFSLYALISTDTVQGFGVVIANRSLALFSYTELVWVYLPAIVIFALSLVSMREASAFRRLVQTNLVRGEEAAKKSSPQTPATSKPSMFGQFWKFRIM